MPLDKSIKKVLVIGSGPIVIGQAAEFDYAGTQACRTLKAEGLNVVLINSNPATIMTDSHMADSVYIEPLTVSFVKKVIEKERPDSMLGTLGGQTGLNLSMELASQGYLDKMGVRLLGSNPETIALAENRLSFKEMLGGINEPCVPSGIVTSVSDAAEMADNIGYPVIIRPAFTLGGTGGGIAHNEKTLLEIVKNGLRLSPIHQVLLEKNISGWKEIEFEVMRDKNNDVIAVASMENFDPVGVHTGDSIVIAPAKSLTDEEYDMLLRSAKSIITELRVEGGCNIQFALKPFSNEYAVIEVNPRVSRSSALASKATGYPIAKVATKIAVGYTLKEIQHNETDPKTGETRLFEPNPDYIICKFPKWPFDKFIYADRKLGTQMKATGEVMAIGMCFEEAIMKAVRGVEISKTTLRDAYMSRLSDDEIRAHLSNQDDRRVFAVFEALKRGISFDDIYAITKIDYWFLERLNNLVLLEKELENTPKDTGFVAEDLYLSAKRAGYLDTDIEKISGLSVKNPASASYRVVDTCAKAFDAYTPYYYSTFGPNGAVPLSGGKKSVAVIGSGPIRIGQGIEFDYSCVHCVQAFKREGFDVLMLNNNPETVSTDYDVADRLYFDPLTQEDVLNVIKHEKPEAVIVAYGGQTAIKLTKFLHENNVKIFGSSFESIDLAEDREKFDKVLSRCGIPRPKGMTAFTREDAERCVNELGFPVLLRPSYVIGGQNMVLAYTMDTVYSYMDIILSNNIESPVLIDKYVKGTEAEVDAICDGEDVLIPGMMEHIERAGVHSGDSIALYPAKTLSHENVETIVSYTKKLAESLGSKGLLNIQYVVRDSEVFVIEANPRASRTIPYISKVTGIPMVDLAVKVSLGEKLRDLGYGTGLYKKSGYKAVKVPVFSFEKLSGVDVQLGPEMKSTGEVLGIGKTFEDALYKGLKAAGYNLESTGGILITVSDTDKEEMLPVAKKFDKLGFKIFATKGNARFLRENGVSAEIVLKIVDGHFNTLDLIESGLVNYVFSTSEQEPKAYGDSIKMRRAAVEMSIPCLTSIDTANTLADCLLTRVNTDNIELVNISKL